MNDRLLVQDEQPKNDQKGTEEPQFVQVVSSDEIEEQDVSGVMPVLPLRGTVVLPQTMVPLAAGQPRSLRLIDDVASGDRRVVLVMQNDPEQDNAGPDEVREIGTLATIHQMMRVPDGTVRLALQGLSRVRIAEWVAEEPYLTAKIDAIPEAVDDDDVETEALMRSTLDLFQRLVRLVSNLPEELITAAINIDDPLALTYLIATNLRMEPEERQDLLELDTVKEKLRQISAFMTKELELLELGKKIQGEVQDEMSRTQREYYLREQLKAIKKELGEADDTDAEVEEIRKQVAEAGMPEEAEREANRELDRLARIPPASAEYGVIKSYLDWLVALPWNVSTEGTIDVKEARRILDRDHYDMERVKERILEYIAVHRLRKQREEAGEKFEAREPILCFVGPPGVGKTSLAQSIAEAVGRKYTRMSLGGVRDESEIRGHRRTYIGAMPGRIIQAIRRAEANDPVFVLDEVDKIGADWRGDPASALLEVLDPEQNATFRDHYLDVPFDLSKVMFITTANLLDPIPAPLRDRMEIIQLSGYTDDEKLNIAKKYLVPKQMEAHALEADLVEWADDGVLSIIQHYTRESGVRNLEREIGSIARKLATKLAAEEELPEKIGHDEVRELLGRPRYFYEELATRTSNPGVAIGVGVNAVGGDIMFIESSKSDGRGSLTITGQLGDVMKESAQAAVSYVRARAESFGIDPAVFKEADIHVHVPAGATPKDGPSAGVALTTALVSLLTGVPARDDVAMTGEVTLRGQVLPVGGIKEKVLAARRAGVTTFILPRRNEADLDDLPEELHDELEFVLVDTIDEALKHSLPGDFEERIEQDRRLDSQTSEQREKVAAAGSAHA
ncbi:MAG: endopeptidase La [Chloroflexota bacterium]